MPYVMVPVPAEHEDEVTQFVLKLTLAAAFDNWDADKARTLLERLDAFGRSVVLHAVRGSVDQELASDRTIAEALEVAAEDVVRCVNAVNELCAKNSWPALLLVDRQVSDGSATHYLVVTGKPARLILQADRDLAER